MYQVRVKVTPDRVEPGNETPSESGAPRRPRPVGRPAKPTVGAGGTPTVGDGRLFDAVRRACEVHDPVPPGLVERMVDVVASAAAVPDDLDYELLVLIERTSQLAGTRGDTTSYTLRFGGDELGLLVRATMADEQGHARLDGWVVPPASGSVEAREVGGQSKRITTVVDDNGRLEFPDLAPGLYRVCLSLDDTRTFQTPAFEI
jgi:hypothetical protein